MSLKPETISVQEQLAKYCRDGDLQDIKGARRDRLHNYRRLVFNVVHDALSQAYPITKMILEEDEWDTLVNDFFSGHDSQSSQIWQMPYELFEYAEATDYHLKLGKPYLLELLYFEWIEIEVYCMPDGEVAEFTTEGDLANDPIVVNPDHRLLHFTYPVHKKSWKELEQHKGNYFVLAFREQETGKVQFIDMSPLFALVFERLAENSVTAAAAFAHASEALGLPDGALLIDRGMPFLEALIEKGAVLGFQSK